MGIKELLTEWGCSSSVIDKFVENEITEEQLHHITGDLLKELIPQVGPRMVLLEKISRFKTPVEIDENLNHRECSMTTFTMTGEGSMSETSSSAISGAPQGDPIVIATGSDTNDEIIIEGNLYEFLRTKFEDFDLKTLLVTSPLGKSILNYYSTYRKLDNTRRNRLVSIIVKHLYNYIVKNRLQKEDYNILSAKIISLFPTETMGTYYCPPISKADHPLGKSIMAKGKLANQVRNLLFRSGDTTARRSKKRKYSDEVEDIATVPSTRDNADILNNEDFVWLQHNSEPWEVVLQKWKITYELRKSNEEKSLLEYFKKWPILTDMRGPILINLDFERLYPESHIAFHLNWEAFFNKILNYKIQEIKENTAQNLYQQLCDMSDTDEKFPLQLTLLNYMLPPRGRAKNWKFSTAESIEGIILHVQNPGDIKHKVEECVQKAYKRNQTVQPYLILEGASIDNIRASYIVFDKIQYQFNSISEAFDLLFKSYHTLNIKYPVQSSHILQLIQNGVYKIKTRYDVVYPENLDILNILT